MGHTYGPTDRCFGVIEQYVCKIDTVYTPQHRYKNICDSNVNFKIKVVEMLQTNFRNYREHLRKLYTERTKDVERKCFDVSSAVWFNCGKGEQVSQAILELADHPSEVWLHHTCHVKEKPQHVSYYKKRGRQAGFEDRAPLLYKKYPIAIKQAKADDLRTLVSSYVPAE